MGKVVTQFSFMLCNPLV